MNEFGDININPVTILADRGNIFLGLQQKALKYKWCVAPWAIQLGHKHAHFEIFDQHYFVLLYPVV